MLYLGADHRGFALKESIKRYLTHQDVPFEDVGATTLEPGDDYVDYAVKVAEAVAKNPEDHRGILLCGSGVGMEVAANKVRGVRAALVTETRQAVASRTDDNANVLVLEADETDVAQASEIVDAWLKTAFSGEERHVRRLQKIQELEKETGL